jgi:hypothetical protein
MSTERAGNVRGTKGDRQLCPIPTPNSNALMQGSPRWTNKMCGKGWQTMACSSTACFSTVKTLSEGVTRTLDGFFCRVTRCDNALQKQHA